MADKKISALTGATTPLVGTEVLPIVQSGATVKVAVSDLTAGRAISATQLTLTAGNVIPANGYGIDFSATPGAGTSELLADYEEGTWTPVIQGAGTAGTYEQIVTRATYTKIGRQVTLQCYITLAGVVTGGGTSYLQVTGAPFTAFSPNQFATTILLTDMAKSLTTLYVGVSWANTTIMYFPEVQPTTFADFPVANAVASKTIQFTMTYFV
jgi:hypothetical protein